jgi:hypothetical protein
MVKKKNQVGVIYEIRVSSASGKSTKPDEYITCSKAEEQPHGWLHYELRDGTNGLAQPKNWRKVEADQQKQVTALRVQRLRPATPLLSSRIH